MYTIALLLAAGQASPVPPTECELLLRKIDARITAAKAIQIEFEIRNDTPGKGDQ